MKKVLVLFAVAMTLCACGKDKITSNTCTATENNMKMTIKMTATNDEIDKVEMTMIPDNSAMGISSFEDLDDDTKGQVKSLLLTSLGLDKDTYEGIEISVDFNENMIMKLNFDLKVADKAILEKLGLDFEDTDMSLERAVKDMKSSGYTCE